MRIDGCCKESQIVCYCCCLSINDSLKLCHFIDGIELSCICQYDRLDRRRKWDGPSFFSLVPFLSANKFNQLIYFGRSCETELLNSIQHFHMLLTCMHTRFTFGTVSMSYDTRYDYYDYIRPECQQ